MSTIVDFSTTNAQIQDEVINVSDSNPINLNHDIFYNKTGKVVVIRTASGGGGTLLTDTTDYTISGSVPDSYFPTSILPDVGYTTVAITNASYHSTNLYVSYYPIADTIRAGRWNVDTTPAGMMMEFAGATAPSGWLDADGAAISRTVFRELFDAIGTAWGVGDGSTTFNLPDMRGISGVGVGNHGTLLKADGSAADGPAVGSYENDQLQGHWHKQYTYDGGASANRYQRIESANANMDDNIDVDEIREAISDGVNGTPRTGDETRGFGAGVLYAIKY